MKTHIENGKLIIKLGERIDSNNAHDTEKEIFDLIEANEASAYAFDASDLAYISSAGLRVLLKIRQDIDKPVEVFNVSRDIYEIFDTTGFTELLTIRKALREISVEGCEAVGEGATSVVYRLDQDTIIKVFKPGVRLDMINDEIRKARNAFLAGVPTAIAYDLVKVGDSFGTVYEMLNATELIKIMVNDKEHITDNVSRFAKFVREMHKIEVDPEDFKPVKQSSIGALPYLVGSVGTEEEIGKIRKIFENIPDRNTFIHGDCHPGNVLIQNVEMMLIDLSNGGSGHPIIVLMSMYVTFRINPADPSKRHESVMLKDFTDDEIKLIWDTFLSSYLDTDDKDLLAKAERQIDGFASARILLAVPFIPGLLSGQAIAFYKQRALDHCESGLEEICF